jgi:hypothetical protein
MADRDALLRRAVQAIGDEPCALIGGQALLLHGFARQTDDVDLLVGTRTILDRARWGDPDPVVSIRPGGDPFDPLDGVVALEPASDAEGVPLPGSPIGTEVIVLDRDWARAILERSHQRVVLAGVHLSMVDLPDLVVLKAYAGGAVDRSDVAAIAEREDWPQVRAEVDRRLADHGPPAARKTWAKWQRQLAD